MDVTHVTSTIEALLDILEAANHLEDESLKAATLSRLHNRVAKVIDLYNLYEALKHVYQPVHISDEHSKNLRSMLLTGLLLRSDYVSASLNFKDMFKAAMENETLRNDWHWAQIWLELRAKGLV